MLGARRGRTGPPPFPAGARIQLLESGLTVGPEPDPDEVYSWDDVGTAALRFEPPTVPNRPLLGSAGLRKGPQNDAAKYLVSTTALTLVKPFSVWLCLRQDAHVVNRRLFDFDANNYIAFGGTAGLYRWEQGATDLVTTTTVADGSIVQLLVQVASGTGGTSRIYLDAVEEHAIAGTATAPASRTIGILARNDGTNPSQATILGAAVWQHADNAAMVAWDRAPIHAYGAWLGAGG
jgi:hypothetical protein